MATAKQVCARITFAVFLATASVSFSAQPPSRTVLVMGDSLSAAHGLAPEQGWVALLTERLTSRKPAWRMVNASISGETSAGGASRIEGELKRNTPGVVVIALGGNDGLRGLPPEQLQANLTQMVKAAKGAGATVLLIGLQMPPNLGKTYTRAFAESFATVAKKEEVALLPFLLEPIALDRDAYQDDGLHPTAQAQPKLAAHVWTALEPLLSASEKPRAKGPPRQR